MSLRTLLSVATLMVLLLLAGCKGDNVAGADDDDDNEVQGIPDAVNVDFSAENQVIRGFGAATVFRLNEPLTDNDMDLLFGSDPGQIGLNILRIRVVPDTDANSRAIELNNALRAKERGAIVVASPWTAPARMKTNDDENTDPHIGGMVKPEFYDDYALYLNDFAEYMADNGAPLHAISIQNEPDWQATYESTDWTGSQMTTFLADHGDKITATKVIAPESLQFRREMFDPILNNPDALANVDIIGGHIYDGGLQPYPEVFQADKELWMTEHLEHGTGWSDALLTGQEMHESLSFAHFNAYIWWYARRFYGPISNAIIPATVDLDNPPEEQEGDASVTRRGFVMSHYTRFVRPGSINVDVTDPTSNTLYISAYKGENDVMVAINNSFAPREITFTLQSGSSTQFTPFTSTETISVSEGIPVSVSNNTFVHTVPPFSITTYQGN